MKVYYEASKQAPDEPWPCSNISACYFELGRYAQSITWAKRALELCYKQGNDKTDPQVQKLEARLDKARLYTIDSPLVGKSRLKILDELPRYRQSM